MRTLIKRLFIGLLCLLPLALTACTQPTYAYGNHPQLAVQAVQLIYYDETDVEKQNYSWFGFKHDPFDNFEMEKCTVLEELPQELFDAFTTDMERSYGASEADTKSPHGYGIRIVREDGSCFVLTWGHYKNSDPYWAADCFVGYYDANGAPIDDYCVWIDPTYCMMIAANYFEMKIPY